MDNSSPATPSPASPQESQPRNRFALTGRSIQLDPRTQAVRRDLADVRLADRIFAPHYAAPVLHRLTATAPLREARDIDSAVMMTLDTGADFEVLELSAGTAWGRAPAEGLVGYVDAALLQAAT